MAENITLDKSELQAMLDQAAASAVAQAEKLRKVDTSQRPSVRAPRQGKGGGGKGPFNLRPFNPKTKEFGSLNDREWLWNPSKITRCPCGEVEFAETQEFIGTFHIEESMLPTILRDQDGKVIATRDAWMTLDTMPEHLERTEEKAAHLRECYANHIAGQKDILEEVKERQIAGAA